MAMAIVEPEGVRPGPNKSFENKSKVRTTMWTWRQQEGRKGRVSTRVWRLARSYNHKNPYISGEGETIVFIRELTQRRELEPTEQTKIDQPIALTKWTFAEDTIQTRQRSEL
jgi:hypothetical protein